MKIKIYAEGGGSRNNLLATKCREGFRRFFEKAGLSGQMPRIVACGSREQAFNDFCIALRSRKTDERPLLVIDSETQVELAPWEHLRAQDGWNQPASCADTDVHFMCQVMEAWFLADPECLCEFFGTEVVAKHLIGPANVEAVAKEQILQRLKMATRACQPKGEYHKGRHSFDILGGIDPAKVRKAAKYADRLLKELESATKD